MKVTGIKGKKVNGLVSRTMAMNDNWISVYISSRSYFERRGQSSAEDEWVVIFQDDSGTEREHALPEISEMIIIRDYCEEQANLFRLEQVGIK